MGAMMVWMLIPVLLVLAGVGGYLIGRGAAPRDGLDPQAVEAIRREVVGLRRLVADLKELAWQHRELDSALSTIIIDEIRAHERRELEP